MLSALLQKRSLPFANINSNDTEWNILLNFHVRKLWKLIVLIRNIIFTFSKTLGIHLQACRGALIFHFFEKNLKKAEMAV